MPHLFPKLSQRYIVNTMDLKNLRSKLRIDLSKRTAGEVVFILSLHQISKA